MEAIIFIDFVIFSMFRTDRTRCSNSRNVAICVAELWNPPAVATVDRAAANPWRAGRAARGSMDMMERVCEKEGVVVGRVGLGDGKVDVDSLLLLRVE